jgi:hypothetical protein
MSANANALPFYCVRVDFVDDRNALMRGTAFVALATVAFDVDETRNLQSAHVVMRATVKRHADDPDPGLAQIDSDALGGISILSGTTALLEITDDVASAFPLGLLHFDVTIDLSASETYPVFAGYLRCGQEA